MERGERVLKLIYCCCACRIEKVRKLGNTLSQHFSKIFQLSLKRLSYLLDIHSFPSSDLSLNQTVLTWPAKIPAIFERGEKIVEESKTRGEATLREKQEKVVIEIEKVRAYYIIL